ncbi:class I tRNA ligase family protein [Acidisphaera sp. S103]|uniref:class I tRNA ligase family protein n=1 Tax=Acidisphaera sp. S103 TaxID=1747223 RepID=UPI00352C6D0F
MPIPPTPNGRAHLGHIAGPYLRMDVLARHLRSWGHRVMSVSATDGFDSYVLWKAQQEGRSPEEVCRDYHRLIRRDLLALDIDMRAFLDVVQGELAGLHAERARHAVEQLVAKGATIEVQEQVLYSRDTGRYIVGAWLEGQCPQCLASASGYFCEACGAHFKPEAMVNPKPRLGDTSLESRAVASLYLKFPKFQRLLDHTNAAGVPPEYQEIVRRYIESEGPVFRLTAPGTWHLGRAMVCRQMGKPTCPVRVGLGVRADVRRLLE